MGQVDSLAFSVVPRTHDRADGLMTYAVLGGERPERCALGVTRADQLPGRFWNPATCDSIAGTRGLVVREIGGLQREEVRHERIHRG